MLAYLDGVWREEAELCLPLPHRGFLYGDGLFETVRVAAGAVCHRRRHLERLFQAARELGLALPASGELEALLQEAVRRNALASGVLRLTVSRGAGPRGLAPTGEESTTVLLTAAPYPYRPEQYRMGYRAVLVSGTRRNECSPLARWKTTAALDGVLAAREARAAGAQEGLLLNTRGFLAEGAVSNLFLVVGGELRTPDEASGCLPGVARAVVRELAEEHGIPVGEVPVAPEDLSRAREAFLTNALLGVMPLVAVDGRPVGDGTPGKLSLQLHAWYEAALPGR
ncbi:MAG: aminotransferase class IV [Thermaerobacter sp.]|nr:aminotransferase class IV [Thermaerobacter sp.]